MEEQHGTAELVAASVRAGAARSVGEAVAGAVGRGELGGKGRSRILGSEREGRGVRAGVRPRRGL